MSQPFVGEIRMFGGNFAPLGWAFCNGQLLAIAQYNNLYNLIGTTYGGDGQSTFALPNLQSRIPIHQGTSAAGQTYVLGQAGGSESVTLTTQQIPSHNHSVAASAAATVSDPTNNFLAGGPTWFATGSPAANLAASALNAQGQSQSHENRMPVLTINFIISLFGVYPSF